MKLLAADLAAAATRLGLTLPAGFVEVATSEDLAALLGHDIRHPRDWTPARHEAGYGGPDGIVFAIDPGGAAIMLLLDEGGVTGEGLWRWDLHEGRHARRIAPSARELPALLERAADRLLDEDR